jgi:GMP synthase-like glutamine amidotransferase
LDVFQLHGETVELAPSGMELLATGSGCRNQAVRVGKNGYGLQCHFELTREMFESWCRIDPDLEQMDYRELMAEFDRRYEEYTATGMKLMENFLRISGLV